MKKLTSSLTILAALAFAGSAMAAPKIYITGSTAFRFGTVNGIAAIYSGGTVATSTGAANGANAATFAGGTVAGIGAVDIKCSWSGSAGGVQTVAATSPTFSVKFLPDGASGTNNPDPRSSTISTQFESARPDVAMSDVFQAATPFNGTFNSVTYNAMTDNTVGICSFIWAASKNFPLNGGTAPLSNYSMTPQIAQALFPGGNVPLSFITGNSADDDTAAIATGRDFDSGTRLTAVSESGVGTAQLLKQYQPTVSSGTVTALALYPRTTINGVDTQQPGNGGESSGSSLRVFLTDTVTSAAAGNLGAGYSGGFLITYLGVSDFNAVSGSGAVGLLYAGNSFSQTNIIEGKYTMWSYEHLLIRSTAVAPVTTFANALTTQIQGEDDATLAPNVSFNSVNAKILRGFDGGPITSQLH